MPHYKFGYWVRVCIEAPDLKTACQAPLRPLCYVDESEPKGALVKQVAGVIVDDVEVEHEHTSVFDDDGRETERYDGEGKLIEPCKTSEEFGNYYAVSADSITTIYNAEQLRAVEVAAQRIGFTRGEDGPFRRPGSDVMHRDADGRPIIEIENEG